MQVHEPARARDTVFFHPDYDRRLRHLTGSADLQPGKPPMAAHLAEALAGSCNTPLDAALTAGGELHPALKTFVIAGKPAGALYQPGLNLDLCNKNVKIGVHDTTSRDRPATSRLKRTSLLKEEFHAQDPDSGCPAGGHPVRRFR
jgi:hypothetical protein